MGISGFFQKQKAGTDAVDVEKFDSELYGSFRKQLWLYHSWGAMGLVACLCAFQVYFMESMGFGFREVSSSELISMNGAYRILMFNSEPWRLLTAIFIHASPLSWLINGLAILSVGALVDRYQGTLRMLLLFFFSAISANLVAGFFQDAGTVWSGATGGIFGLYFGLIAISAKVDFRLFRKFDWFILPFFLWDTFSKAGNAPMAFAGAVMGAGFMVVLYLEYFSSKGARASLLAGWAVFGYLMSDKLLPTLQVTKDEVEMEKKNLMAQRSQDIFTAAKVFLSLRENFNRKHQDVLSERLATSDMKVWMLKEFHPELKNMRQSISQLRSPTMKIYAVQKSIFEDLILLDKICQEISGGFVGDQIPYWKSIEFSLGSSLKNVQLTLAEALGPTPRTAADTK